MATATEKWVSWQHVKVFTLQHYSDNVVFPKCFTEFSDKGLKPTISCVIDQDAATAPAIHM